MKKLLRYPLLLIFVLFIFGVSIADVFATGKAYSETENRALKQRPAFSLPALVKNEYTKNYETFVCDQFVARDSWISLKSLAEKALGKQENNGVAFGADSTDKITSLIFFTSRAASQTSAKRGRQSSLHSG